MLKEIGVNTNLAGDLSQNNSGTIWCSLQKLSGPSIIHIIGQVSSSKKLKSHSSI